MCNYTSDEGNEREGVRDEVFFVANHFSLRRSGMRVGSLSSIRGSYVSEFVYLLYGVCATIRSGVNVYLRYQLLWVKAGYAFLFGFGGGVCRRTFLWHRFLNIIVTNFVSC